MAELVQAFMAFHSIDKASLLGYSMGGKVSLSLLELMPAQIERVTLFAPDGIQIHPAYWFASRTWLGQNLYRSVITKPGFLFGLAKAAAATKIISPKLKEIVLFNMSSRAKRQLLHDAWMSYRNFNPDLKRIDELLADSSIPLEAYFGKYDKVITADMAKKMEGLMPNAKVLLLESGHLNLIKQVVQGHDILGTKKGAKGPSH